MRLTKGQAQLAFRLCRYVGAACLLGIVALLGTGNKHKSLPPVVGFSQTPPHADPVVYKQFFQLEAGYADPFSFQEPSINKRSFVVMEEEPIEEPPEIEPEPEPEPEPELDTDDLNLLAILLEKGRRYAVLHDLRESGIIKVKIGDSLRGAKVVSIGQAHLVLRLSDKDFTISWQKKQKFSD